MHGGDRGPRPDHEIYLIKNRHREVYEVFCRHSLPEVGIIKAAHIRSILEKKGTPIGPFDLLIAGQARSQGLTLVTNNIREFGRVDGLALENRTEE